VTNSPLRSGCNSRVASASWRPFGQTVLFVDDEAAIRASASEVLHDIGCVHLEAADAASAMRLLESDTKIDLLISDVGLPGGMMDGRCRP
jgi:CheY-like chemotaxis protein